MAIANMPSRELKFLEREISPFGSTQNARIKVDIPNIAEVYNVAIRPQSSIVKIQYLIDISRWDEIKDTVREFILLPSYANIMLDDDEGLVHIGGVAFSGQYWNLFEVVNQ